MTGKLAHRGPDDSGIFVNNNIGLGHRRLAVIDLSERGRQPMQDRKKRYTIVFNGEIYNYRELAARLEKDGVRFASQTDTEVILYLYEKLGPACLADLRGMFALAIWDQEKSELFLARDRLGKKPLKYYLDGQTLVFASELKAILTQKEVKKEIDWSAVNDYLTFKYVPAPHTGFKNIFKLPPAHYALIRPGQELRIAPYWKLDYEPKEERSENDWANLIEKKLSEAVGLRLSSDVPLGALLSGGVDSGLVLALMSRLSEKPVKTFTIAFGEKEYDESAYARLTARRYNTEHEELLLKPRGLEILPILAKMYEEPYADASAIPTYYLSELTRQRVTVALNGDGGDENFAGYDRYRAAQYYSLLKPLPAKKTLAGLLHWSYSAFRTGALERASRLLEADYSGLADFYLDIISYFKNAEKNRLFAFAAADSGRLKDYKKLFEKYSNLSLTDRLLAISNLTHLPDDLLVKTDIASMAHGLELRSPFLDHEFMELCARLPDRLKLKGTDKKYLLKKIARRHLPLECVNRPKQGFTVPLEYWFKNELLGYLSQEILAPDFLSYGFRREYIEELLKRQQSGKFRLENRLYSLLMLKLWLKEYF